MAFACKEIAFACKIIAFICKLMTLAFEIIFHTDKVILKRFVNRIVIKYWLLKIIFLIDCMISYKTKY